MKKYSFTIDSPQKRDIFTYGYSPQLKRTQRRGASKRSYSLFGKNNSQQRITLPAIPFHIPSYEIISKAKKKKQQTHLSTPKFKDRSLIDYSQRNIVSKNQVFNAIQNSVASKVDFFDTLNQRRLDIKKRKVFVNLGIIKVDRQPIFITNKRSPNPQIYKLLQKYITKKQISQTDQEKYILVGKQFQVTNIDSNLSY